MADITPGIPEVKPSKPRRIKNIFRPWEQEDIPEQPEGIPAATSQGPGIGERLLGQAKELIPSLPKEPIPTTGVEFIGEPPPEPKLSAKEAAKKALANVFGVSEITPADAKEITRILKTAIREKMPANEVSKEIQQLLKTTEPPSIFLDPTEFAAGALTGGVSAAPRGAGAALKSALRGGVAFQTLGLSEVPGLAMKLPGLIRFLRANRQLRKGLESLAAEAEQAGQGAVQHAPFGTAREPIALPAAPQEGPGGVMKALPPAEGPTIIGPQGEGAFQAQGHMGGGRRTFAVEPSPPWEVDITRPVHGPVPPPGVEGVPEASANAYNEFKDLFEQGRRRFAQAQNDMQRARATRIMQDAARQIRELEKQYPQLTGAAPSGRPRTTLEPEVIGKTTARPIEVPPEEGAVARGPLIPEPAEPHQVFEVKLGDVRRRIAVDNKTGRVTAILQEGPTGAWQDVTLTGGDWITDYMRKYNRVPFAIEAHLRNSTPNELRKLRAMADDMKGLAGAEDFKTAIDSELARRGFATSKAGTAQPMAPGQLAEGGIPPEPAEVIADKGPSSRAEKWLRRPGKIFESTTQGTPPESAAAPKTRPSEPLGRGGPQVAPRGGEGNPKDFQEIFDPAVDQNSPVYQQYASRFMNWLKERLTSTKGRFPSELSILKQAPGSSVISEVSMIEKNLSEGVSRLLKQPWMKAIIKRQGDLQWWANRDEQAYNLYHRAKAGGMSVAQAWERAITAYPVEIRDYFRYRAAQNIKEAQARVKLGLEPFDLREGVYLPRKVEKDIEVVGYKGNSLAEELQQTIRSHQKERQWETMNAGIANQEKYIDPVHAIILREWETMKLLETARFMEAIEKSKAIFRSPEAVKAATGKQGFATRGLPGNQDLWYTATDAERQFLVDNLSNPKSRLGSMVYWANNFFRAPNLINPLPHITKNMGYKYLLAANAMGVNPASASKMLIADAVEFFKNANPALRARFETVMPFSGTNALAHELLMTHLMNTPSRKLAQALTLINKPSGALIFKYADPAMRYGLWKQYVAKGLSDQAAANNVWVDLIRYGTRSELVDFWKAIPANMFVPWRLGTTLSLIKAFKAAPLRTALYIGAVDLVREMAYRQTGRWFHAPVDYLEGPISRIVRDPSLRNIGVVIGTTALFGPGGSFSAKQLSDIAMTVTDWDFARLQNTFWGLGQVYNLSYDLVNAVSSKDKTEAIKAMASILSDVSLATHVQLTRSPERNVKAMETWIPGLAEWKKMEEVREAEEMSAKKERKAEERLWEGTKRTFFPRMFQYPPMSDVLEDLEDYKAESGWYNPIRMIPDLRVRRIKEPLEERFGFKPTPRESWW